MMKILFYDTCDYDRDSFNSQLENFPDIHIDYLEAELLPVTASLAKGYDAVCAFVNANISAMTLEILRGLGVKCLLMRCAGFNNINLDVARHLEMTILRVPGYSPQAIAEHAMALALTASRRICRAYNRVRNNDFALSGLLGPTFYGKTAGIVGTGKIGAAMCNICRGFGMKVIAFDVYKNPDLDFVEYVDTDELFKRSDLISLHCPLFDSNYHLINDKSIAEMKDGVIFVNTARGGLVETSAVIRGIRSRKFGAVGLDVYEEESGNAFQDRSSDIIESVTGELLQFPNVVVTSHQAFFTHEALSSIAETTLNNAMAFYKGSELPKSNLVK